MFHSRFVANGASLLALGRFSTTSLAQTHEDMSFDGRVSKQEFLDTMTKIWEVKAKKMKVTGDKMTPDDFKQILMYLKAGS